MQALAKIILHHLSHFRAAPRAQMGSPNFSGGYTQAVLMPALSRRKCKAVIILAEQEGKESWIHLHITFQGESVLR